MSKVAQYHLHKFKPQKLQFEIYDLKSYLQKNRDKATVPHSHSYYQLIWFFNSKGTHLVDFKTYKVTVNTIILIAKDQVHAFDKLNETEGLLIHFNDSFFMHTEVDIFLKYSIFKTHENSCYTLEENAAETGKTYVELIKKELLNRNEFGFEDTVRFLLKCFLIRLERIHRKRQPDKINANTANRLRFYQFKELIEVNYKKGMSVNEYASLLAISSKTLNTITKSIADKSPSELITERIVLESKRLVKFTTLQISEIAFKLGFEDPSYFIKYFKRHLKMAPLKFRNGS
ncbi:helix-turn-helix domain-containing protein [Croceitalea sp. MTPC5]|uniref:AraC family transcriptional regulator n=1 Tax=Croceitalea sp. MTPC5 TaxID=3056565 RepID=UPI002B3D55A9|nr:helix-turn-helix domain-containing protein [Croceitalea sp. MTPC5]